MVSLPSHVPRIMSASYPDVFGISSGMYFASRTFPSFVPEFAKGQFVPTVHALAVLLHVQEGFEIGNFVLEPQTTTFCASLFVPPASLTKLNATSRWPFASMI